MCSFMSATLLAVAASASLMLLGCGGDETTPGPNPTASERFESRVTNLKKKDIDALTRDWQGSPASAGQWWSHFITWRPQGPEDPNYPGGFGGNSTDYLREQYLDPFVKCYIWDDSSQVDVSVSKFHEGKGVGVLVFKSPCAVMSVETLVFNDAGIDLHWGFVAEPKSTAGLLGMGHDLVSDRMTGCPDRDMTRKIIEASSSDNVTEMYSDDALLMFVDLRNAIKEVNTYAGKSDIGKFLNAESSWLDRDDTPLICGNTDLAKKMSNKKFECADDATSYNSSGGTQIWGASFHTGGLVLLQTIVAYDVTARGTLEDSFVF